MIDILLQDDGCDCCELRKINATEDWLTCGYDESGDEVECKSCGGTLRWSEESGKWTCEDCGHVVSRSGYFDRIGATPPGEKCLAECSENYPLCKKWCLEYDISEDSIM